MPPTDGEINIPVDGDGSRPPASPTEPNGDEAMEESFASLLTHQLAQSGNIAQNNFITVQKIVDYDFLENKRIVTLDEAVGVREVSSKYVPAGPASGP